MEPGRGGREEVGDAHPVGRPPGRAGRVASSLASPPPGGEWLAKEDGTLGIVTP